MAVWPVIIFLHQVNQQFRKRIGPSICIYSIFISDQLSTCQIHLREHLPELSAAASALEQLFPSSNPDEAAEGPSANACRFQRHFYIGFSIQSISNCSLLLLFDNCGSKKE